MILCSLVLDPYRNGFITPREWEKIICNLARKCSRATFLTAVLAILWISPLRAETVFAVGDIAQCELNGAKKTAKLLKNTSGKILLAGDIVYPNGAVHEYLKCFDPVWGSLKDRIYPTPGNHDYDTTGAVGYYRYFGDRAGVFGKGYYSFDLPGWHVIAINSNIETGKGSAQLLWLEEDLKKNKSSCILAFWHHPRYTSGLHGDNTHMHPIWELLANYRATLVVNGHDHNYERLAPLNAEGEKDPLGIRTFIVGTGGARLINLRLLSSASEVWDGTTWGVLKLDLEPSFYRWTFVPVKVGAFSDSGEGRCVG